MRLLFVCLGNICRSPAAEGILDHMVKNRALDFPVIVDSAGTGDWHVGESPDSRMRQAATRRGYNLNSFARQICTSDLETFDLILTMDSKNYENVCNMTDDESLRRKIQKFANYCESHAINDVPDPYFGGASGFEHVLDILEDGCNGLLKSIISKHQR